MPQLVPASGLLEDSPGSPREVSLPCLRPKAVWPRACRSAQGLGGRDCGTAGAPLRPPGLSVPLNLQGMAGSESAERREHPASWVGGGRVSAHWALPIQELGSCLPLLTPAGEKLTDPQGPGAGTNDC